MNEQHTPISEEEIHAYVDGALAEHRRAELDRLLETDNALATRISDYFALNNMLHDRYDRVLLEPVPQRLKPHDPAPAPAPVAKKRWLPAANWPQFAGLAAALVVGIGIGVGGMTSQPARDMLLTSAGDMPARHVSASREESFARQSAIAYVTYAPMVTRPVEVGADQEQELVKWLSSRLGTDVHAPILTRVGFSLMGGRLLPGEDGPIAQFMYHDASGERITLNVSHRKVSRDVTAFKLFQDGSVNVFYWVDGDFGYAVSGAIDRKVLLDVSHDVYEQLTERSPPKSAP
ncbi:transmembrane transcriptional regulator (anti-sigma factor) [Caballeronia terrestris]|jgi:anti-sigma factor RsiW|uniref:Transmembrane transcriptional regulator (Anti-sigma factor) n=1 Tax=Caballeronia terrestris TaxID=1226301 RepID=A0A158FR68_9BURK|nr:anti-sigma factor [Caballeronia terrestris]SAL22121.1 transmembrane transcriptional regulator (anti-sigma factor) [Caballeronia terrestris]